MNPELERRRPWPPVEGRSPPSWAVGLVRCCAVGTLLLPPLAAALLAGGFALRSEAGLLPLGAMAALALWGALFACAKFVTARYPPVPRAR